MGADGGTLAKRSEIVSRDTSKQNVAELKSLDTDVWTRCALSGEELHDPVVSDWGGYLYNKKAILEFLLGTAKFAFIPKTSIRQIRDITELTRELVGANRRWIDPISRKDIALEGSSQSLAYIVECGHIGPYQVLANSHTHCCLVCERSYEDVVIMNPQSAYAKSKNKQRIEKLNLLGLSHSLRPREKRAKKRSQERAQEEDASEPDADNDANLKTRRKH